MAVLALFSSCSSPLIPDEENEEESDGNLIIKVSCLERTPLSAPTHTDTEDVCTRLNFAVYDRDGIRVKQINQTLNETNFGTASFQLAEGDYKLVVVAHSSNGNPTMTNPAKIQFTNAKGFTDTFLFCDDIIIADEPLKLDLVLNRIVALCRVVITDAYPKEVAKMQFVYKGGSGAFNASTGLGCVNSTQTVTFGVTPSQKPFDLYTFLHNTEGIIHLKASALDASDNVLFERSFEVSLQQCKDTWLSGPYFSGDGNGKMSIYTNTEWLSECPLAF